MRIVFVHLNSQLPKYLEENIKYCKEVFPKNEVTLIHNQPYIRAKIPGVRLFQYLPDSRWQNLEDLYEHDKEFRNNFWLTSTARFFALEEFMMRNSGSILHVESDVLLSADFPFDQLVRLRCALAFPIISDLRGVASTLFVRDIKAAGLLTSNIIDEVKSNPRTTEMIMLKKLYDDNRDQILPLPIGPNVASAFGEEASDFLEVWSSVYEELGGIVDGVDIGQYFFGTDPRNRRGKVLIRTNLVNGFSKVENWMLTFNEDRLFVDVRLDGGQQRFKVFSLHLPVKRKQLFQRSRHTGLIAKCARTGQLKPGSFLMLDVLVKAIWKSLVKRIKRILPIK